MKFDGSSIYAWDWRQKVFNFSRISIQVSYTNHYLNRVAGKSLNMLLHWISSRSLMFAWLKPNRYSIKLLLINHQPQSICTIEELSRVVVTREDDVSNSVSVFILPDKLITFSMEDRDANEFAIVLAGYYRLIVGECSVVIALYERSHKILIFVSILIVQGKSWRLTLSRIKR